MDTKSEKDHANAVISVEQHTDTLSIIRADDAKLAELGYKSEFRREFSVCMANLTISMIVSSVRRMTAFGDHFVCVFDHGSDC